jgi:mannosyl-3-phosphoglycerate phosphatase
LGESKLSKKIIFTDIDGTLIESVPTNYDLSLNIVTEVKKMKIPLILCSSKTRLEQNRIRKLLGLKDPYIVENGGAIIIPNNYFSRSLNEKSKIEVNDEVIGLGLASQQIKIKLNEIRDRLHLSFKGVSDLSLNEISKITGLNANTLKGIKKREYGETILVIDQKEKIILCNEVEKFGLRVIHGGRFFDVTGGNDKGTAMKVLVDLFKKHCNNNITTFAIGDSRNDEPMFEIADFPMLVKNQKGKWIDTNIQNIIKLDGIGPKGWNKALEIISKK